LELRQYLSDSESDSDESIDTILNLSRLPSRTSCRSTFDDDTRSVTSRIDKYERTFDAEYYSLPLLEKLSLNEIVKFADLQEFGLVESTIDFIVTLQPHSTIPPLDYNSVIFDNTCGVIGQIFEIYGLITEPRYAIRFNTCEEAAAWLPGTKVYYAPKKHDLTFTVFADDLLKIRYNDDAEQADYSDDEEERQQFQKQRAKDRSYGNAFLSSGTAACLTKRARLVSFSSMNDKKN